MCFNMKFSTYFHMKTKILADYQICISVPLSQNNSFHNLGLTPFQFSYIISPNLILRAFHIHKTLLPSY